MKWQTTGQVEFDLLVVQMPEATAMPLIPELRDRRRSTKAAGQVLKLVSEQKATLIGWPVLSTKSGQRAVVEQIDEFRYATEFDSPGRSVVTKSLTTPGNAEQKAAAINELALSTSKPPGAAARSENGSSASPVPEAEKKEWVQTTTDIHYGTPSAFETRNVGVTLEVEPVVGPDGRTIDLNLVPQHVRLLGMRKAYVEQVSTKEKVIVESPEFLTNKVTTSLQVVDGEHTLLGVFKVNDPPGTVELFILHTQLKRIEVPVGRAKTILNPADPAAAEGRLGRSS